MQAGQDSSVGKWLPLPDAALRLRISEHTVRRRAKQKELPSRKVQRPQGYRWEVFVSGDQIPASQGPVQLLPDGQLANSQSGDQSADQLGAQPTQNLSSLVELIRELNGRINE